MSGANYTFERYGADEKPVGASVRIEEMLQAAPAEGLTIDWLLAHLFSRSPEILFLAFTPVAVVPATSTFAGALLLVAAMPLVLHRRGFLVPTFLARRTIPVEKVERSFKGLLVILKFYETYALRRPHLPERHHTKLVGVLVATLSAALLIPLPFSNVLPGLTIGAVALASLEQDERLLLLATLLTGISLLVVLLEAVWLYHLVTVLL